MVKFYERLGQTARCNVVGIIGRQHSCLTGDIPLKRPLLETFRDIGPKGPQSVPYRRTDN